MTLPYTRSPVEADLKSERSALYSAAMLACGSGDPSWCSANGQCRRGGDCFRKPLVSEALPFGPDLLRLSQGTPANGRRAHGRLTPVGSK